MARLYPKVDTHGRPRTPYAVQCMRSEFAPNCGRVYLTDAEYMQQLNAPNSTWRCPRCGDDATWDDGNYEEFT